MQVKNEMIHSDIVDARQALIPYKDKEVWKKNPRKHVMTVSQDLWYVGWLLYQKVGAWSLSIN